MKQLFVIVFALFALCANAQQSVTKVSHSKAVKTDVVATGDVTIRKPEYICISTDGGKDQLIMDGTKFTMTQKGKKHVTDSKSNPQFATFHAVLKAVINRQAIPTGNDITTTTKGSEQTITITPSAQKRQMFTSFVLVIDSKTSAMKRLRMNGRNESYTEYTFK
ncbi:MAG: outer membrane lipoprotein carrier protein LolA [Prevotella sp.]|jgi:hypothetical protein|nr:outer membrane lipoprotein carrier protein LolA [Prevotella sp.]